MGQSQLLLVIIGVLIIGIALLAASGFFESGEVDANRRAIVVDINQIAHLAVRWFQKPSALGGGGHKYDGFTIPTRFRSNQNGNYSSLVRTSSALEVTGISALDSANQVIAQIDTYGKAYNFTFTGDFQ